MSNYYVNNNFHGAIGGKRCSDYYREINGVNKATLEEQLEFTHEVLGTEIIDGIEFYDEFWTKVFLQDDEEEYVGGIKLILNKDDSLYSESNVARTLELMGTKLLKLYDSKEDEDEKVIIYDSEELFKKAIEEQVEIHKIINSTSQGKYSKENKLDGFTLEDKSDYLMYNKKTKKSKNLIVLRNQMNYKLERKITKLSDSDLKILNDMYGTKYPLVNCYYQAYVSLKKQYKEFTQCPKENWIHKPKEQQRFYKYKSMNTKEDRQKKKVMSRNIYSLKDDFIQAIYRCVRFIEFKAPLPDGTPTPYKDKIMFKKHELVEALRLLRNVDPTEPFDFQEDLQCMLYDLMVVVKECEFTEIQEKVLKLLMLGMTQEKIAKKLNMTKSAITQHINGIIKRIDDKQQEKYWDWFYLNIRYGEYKKCSKCGEIKLVQNFDKNGKRGYMSMCKNCRKK